MSILRDLPWTWISGILAALAVLAIVLKRRTRRGRPHRAYGSDGGYPIAMAASSEQKTLLQAVQEVRGALERQSREMTELRAFWSQRLDELNGRIAALSPALPRTSHGALAGPRGGSDFGDYVAPLDAGTYGSESLGWTSAGAEPAWSPGPGDQPVEVRDGALVTSRSLPPAGYVAVTGGGQARVYLNADAPLTEFSLPKWKAFFDLQGERPYAAYRTRRPAEVRWDEMAGRGELIRKGLAEAI